MPTKNKTNTKHSVKAKKKPVTKKNAKPGKSAHPAVLSELKKILVGIAILISLCLTLAMVADIFLHSTGVDKEQNHTVIKKPQNIIKIKPVQEGIREVKSKKAVTGLKQKPEKTIKYEVFGEIDQTLIEKKFPSPEKGHVPKIVIIIDDIGYDKKIAMALSDLNPNITFSVLPFAPFGKTISKQLHARGSQLMLHLPMEPFEYPNVNPGPGAILSSMSPDILLDQLEKNIDDIPNIVGVNNHMGSKITTNSDQMNQIFSALKKKDLFFIDSRTAPRSKCKSSARLFKLKFAQRDVFLDNFQNQEYITGQFNKLKALAEKHGFAIGIGHPYQATLHTLARELPKLEKKIQIVRASVLTAVPG